MAILEDRIKQQARALGFDLVGIAPAGPADSFDRMTDWLAQGFAGEMGYMERHAEARRDPSSILPEVRSVVMVAMNYAPNDQRAAGFSSELLPLPSGGEGRGEGAGASTTLAPSPPTPLPRRGEGRNAAARIARYARGTDYHDVLRERLKRLLAWIQEQSPGCRGRAVVDTAPLLERDFARRAGLGWFGKNTMLIHKRLGSYFFLGALLLDIPLSADAPFESSHCGRCTACLDACPTQAFVAPGMLDSRRCISYLTIELRGPIPEELRRPMGGWLFGCDVCQEVCPWNRKAPAATEPAILPRAELEAVDPIELLGLSEQAFRERFRDTALWRTKRAGLLRNAAIVLGNRRDRAALPALRRALADPEPLVREAANWAIAEIEASESSGERRGLAPP